MDTLHHVRRVRHEGLDLSHLRPVTGAGAAKSRTSVFGSYLWLLSVRPAAPQRSSHEVGDRVRVPSLKVPTVRGQLQQPLLPEPRCDRAVEGDAKGLLVLLHLVA
jgi:hypothetical protein